LRLVDRLKVHGGGVHAARLMGPSVVVVVHPLIHRRLRRLQVIEGAVVVEQFGLDALVPAFDLPGCCR
jgi:hypothetical protein